MIFFDLFFAGDDVLRDLKIRRFSLLPQVSAQHQMFNFSTTILSQVLTRPHQFDFDDNTLFNMATVRAINRTWVFAKSFKSDGDHVHLVYTNPTNAQVAVMYTLFHRFLSY